MKQYENYQETKIDWLSSIPATWSAKRIKNLFSLHDERSYKPLNEVNLISLYTSVGVRQHSDIEHTTGNKARNADGYKIVNVDDIIVNIMLCWMGAIGRSAYQGVTSPAYDVYTPHNNVNASYYHYLFRIPLFSQQCFRNGHGIMMMRWRTYSQEFCNIIVPVPPREEQDQIVRFLDWKTSEINKTISIQNRAISVLTETMEGIIDKAVIRGLHNANLDSNDDIRWMVQYPKHWTIARTREHFSFRKGLSITKANLVESGVPVVSYGQVHSKTNTGVGLNDTLIRFVDESYLETGKSSIVEKGDFIFADTSEDLTGCGNCVYIDSNETIFAGYHSIIMHPDNIVKRKYMAYLFKSPTWRYQIRKAVNAVKVYTISQAILKDTFILIPPVSEQDEITSYLDIECEKIYRAIELIKLKIQKLQEFKARLISNVVTGRIDVRGINIPAYEYIAEEADSHSEAEDLNEQED